MQVYQCEKCGHVYNANDKCCPLCGTRKKVQTSKQLRVFSYSLVFTIATIFMSIVILFVPMLLGSTNTMKYSTYSNKKIDFELEFQAGKYDILNGPLFNIPIGNHHYLVSFGEINNFWYDSGDLKSIIIPAKYNPYYIIEFGSYEHSNLSTCQKIEVSRKNKKYDSRQKSNAVIRTGKDILLAGCKNTIIPNSVVEIGSHAFEGCDSLLRVVIPASVEQISNGAFKDCRNLETVFFDPATNLEHISADAFSGCVNLNNIVLPNEKESIADFINKSIQSGILSEIYFEEDLEYHTKLLDKYGYELFHENNLFGVKSKSSAVILPAEYKSIYLSDDGNYLHVINQSDKVGFYSINHRQWTIPCLFDEILPFDYYMFGKGTIHFPVDDDFLFVKNEGKCGIYNYEGNEIAPIIYNSVSHYNQIWGIRNMSIDIIDPISHEKLSIACEDAIPCQDTLCLIKRNSKWGVINDDGEIIIPTQYDNIPDQTEGDLHGIIESYHSLSQIYASDANYARQYYSIQKEIIVENNGKFGLVGLDGKEYLPCEYDSISWYQPVGLTGYYVRLLFKGNYDRTQQVFDGDWGVYFSGIELIPCSWHSSTDGEQEILRKGSDQIEEEINQKLKHIPVDLGLSVKWGRSNIGANKPEDFGDYFAWGELEAKSNYNMDSYKWSMDNGIIKYNYSDGLKILEADDDIAHIQYGAGWRMPTIEEWQELEEKCTWALGKKNGVIGCLVTSKINGNSIFLPLAGESHETKIGTNRETVGQYWSSTMYDLSHAHYFDISASIGTKNNFTHSTENGMYRYYGSSVRPVCE